MDTYNFSFLGPVFETNQTNKYQTPLKYAKEIKQKEEICNCPLCGEKRYLVVGKFKIDLLINNWIERKGINPIADVYRGESLEKRRCKNCGLVFYNYHLPDSEELYQALESQTIYYPAFRMEYGKATEIIESIKPYNLIEIGAGDGSFLGRIQHIVPRVVGSEYNSHAAQVCREKGFEIYSQDILKIDEQFDVVCHFEVLEHVFETKIFMEQTLRLLKKGGKLIIGTPDPDGILSVVGEYELNLPPHHQFDFSKQSFDWLAKEFNLKIYDYQKSELEYRSYSRYVKKITGVELAQPDISGFYETQKKYTGASHVVVFEKK